MAKTVTSPTDESEYHLADLEELLGYVWLKPEVTQLNNDIFVDDGEAYKRDGHIPLLFVRNGYDWECDEYIPISISDTPRILDNSIKMNVSETDMDKIFEFIRVNRNELISFANGRIDVLEFCKDQLPFRFEKYLGRSR